MVEKMVISINYGNIQYMWPEPSLKPLKDPQISNSYKMTTGERLLNRIPNFHVAIVICWWSTYTYVHDVPLCIILHISTAHTSEK